MRWVFRIIGLVALAALLALGALVAIPTERIATLATDRIGQATGRSVEIAGEVRPTLWPHLGIRAEGLRVGNPDWVTDGPLIAAEELDVAVNWSALIAGEVRLEAAELVAPDITLVREADGRASWDFGRAARETDAAPGDAAPALIAIGFDRATIRNGRLRILDAVTGQDLTITEFDATLSLPDLGGQATVEAEANVNGTALSLAADIEDLAGLLDGAVRPLGLSLDWSGGSLGFDGRLSTAPALDGDLTLSATDLAPILTLAGAAMPDLPQGLGRDRIEVSGQVTLANEGSAHLRDGQLGLDDNSFALALDLLPGDERPMIRGVISGGRLSVPGLTGGAGDTTGSGTASGSGWPADRIDVSGLFAADADVSIRLDALDLGMAEIAPVEMRSTLTRGRLVNDIARIGAYGGRLSGQFVVNGRGGLSVGGDLILADVQLNPLVTDFASWDRLEGSGSASLQFLGVGDDLATIMDGLSGQGDLSFGAGAILGLDLAGMIRNFDASYQGEGTRTVYDRIAANFTIADGVLANDDLILDAPWGEVRGAGRVDLGAQSLDYRVIPGVMRDDEGVAGIQVPVLVTGPWASPSFRPDLEYLAEQELAEQAARLEAEARARLEAEQDRLEQLARDRANEVLGTDIEAGDTLDQVQGQVQEALQNQLGGEAQNQLLNLFGGDN